MVAKKKSTEKPSVGPPVDVGLGDADRTSQILKPVDFNSGPSVGALDAVAIELRKAREAKSLSLSDLHRLTAISRTTLHDYESGRSKPGAKELVALCRALEVSPNRILLGVEDLSVQSGGVLVGVIRLAKAKPAHALVLSAFMVPWVAAVLSKIGQESLMALGTIADETLRARDPATYRQMSLIVSELGKIDWEGLSKMSPSEQQEVMQRITKKIEEMQAAKGS